ncbi:MAG: cytochrome-c peroxidase [Panacagrimonas sp.]
MRGLVLCALAMCLATTAESVAISAPQGWPEPKYRFDNNPITGKGFELGRRLFYDPVLSIDGSVSCASCHQQASAFAHARHALSHGIRNQLGTRNAPVLFNLAWQPDFMHDGAATHLEMQPLLPLANPVEMGESPAHVIEKLRSYGDYRRGFEQAFGSPGIDTQRLLRALAQFTGSIVSSDSRYDRVRAGQDRFTETESKGHEVFAAQCASCHTEPLFTDFSYRRLGRNEASPDIGRMGVTGKATDRGRFRVPSLRNVEVSGPYLHDGSLPALTDVIDQWNAGDHVEQSSNGSNSFQPISPADRTALLAFLATLTDHRLLRDPRFAEPASPAASSRERVAHWLGSLFSMRAEAAIPRPATPESYGNLAISTDSLSVVVVPNRDTLLLYVDELASNAPIDGLSATVIASGQVRHAKALGDGVYTVPADGLDWQVPHDLSIRLRGPTVDLKVRGALAAIRPSSFERR